MITTMSEAMQEFKNNNVDHKNGKSAFVTLCPAHIVPISNKDQSLIACSTKILNCYAHG